jgi:hypothetical protein
MATDRHGHPDGRPVPALGASSPSARKFLLAVSILVGTLSALKRRHFETFSILFSSVSIRDWPPSRSEGARTIKLPRAALIAGPALPEFPRETEPPARSRRTRNYISYDNTSIKSSRRMVGNTLIELPGLGCSRNEKIFVVRQEASALDLRQCSPHEGLSGPVAQLDRATVS